MAKGQRKGKKGLDEAWKALPESDKRCISALIVLTHTIGDKTLSYREPSAALQRTLRKLDRDSLFSDSRVPVPSP